jgi:hypothetical protein
MSETKAAPPDSDVVRGHKTQPGRAAPNKTFARVRHRSPLQPHVHGIADPPDDVQLALAAVYGKAGNVGRREHERVRIGRACIHHDV